MKIIYERSIFKLLADNIFAQFPQLSASTGSLPQGYKSSSGTTWLSCRKDPLFTADDVLVGMMYVQHEWNGLLLGEIEG